MVKVSQQQWGQQDGQRGRRFGPAFWIGAGGLIVIAIGGASDGGGLGGALSLASVYIGITAVWHMIRGRSWVTPLIPASRKQAIIGIPVALAVMTTGGLLLPPQATTAAEPASNATTASASAPDTPSVTPSRTPSVTPTPTPSLTSAKAGQDTALAILATLPVKGRAPKTGYDRALFGQAWADTDHNGCDTRNDILQRDLEGETFKDGTKECVILTGTLHDPYTGRDIAFKRGQTTSSEIQIDNVVALSDAWQKGAQQIGDEQRRRLANDPLNLLAVDGPTNQQKSDGDAATWLPANKPFRCQYVARQVAVKHDYRLWVTQAEHDAIAGILASCKGQKIPAAASPDVNWQPKAAPVPTKIAPAPTHRATKKAAAPRKAAPTRQHTTQAPAAPETTHESRDEGTVHGGSYCSVEGATGTSSSGNTLTCKVAKDGRLRWKK